MFELKSCSSFIWLFEDADVYDWSKENFTPKNSRHIIDLVVDGIALLNANRGDFVVFEIRL